MALLQILCFLLPYLTVGGPIEGVEVENAQKAWAAAIVNIGVKHKEGQTRDYIQALADHLVDDMYAFSISPTLLKPNVASDSTADPKGAFCTTRDCAITHFIGDGGETTGYALQSVAEIRLENVGLLLQGDAAMAMGNCYVKDSAGVETRSEYSLAYIKDSAGKLRISHHHASFPASAAVAATSAVVAAPAEATAQETTTTAPAVAAETTTTTTAVAETTTTAVAAAETTTIDASAAEQTMTTTTTTAATTTTTTEAPRSTTDWFFDGHAHNTHHHDHGLHSKMKPQYMVENQGGGFASSMVKILVLVLIAGSLTITALMAQVKSHFKLTPADRFSLVVSMLRKKLGNMLKGNSRGDSGFGGFDKGV